jgi:uncharacterized protein YdeI (YjbR/CyaY-like superfamily)
MIYTEPLILTIPDELADALESDSVALRRFERLTFTEQRRLIQPIDTAARSATRKRRIASTMSLLRRGRVAA